MKLTLGQFEPMIEDKATNLQTMEEIMKDATKEKADLVLFPELSLTGYFIQNSVNQMAEPIDGRSIQHMQHLCRTYELHVVFSWPEVGEDNHIYNSACLIDDHGEVIGTYRKVHLYDREKEIFTPGREFKVFDTELGRIGIMICFDLDFPESARLLKLKDADIILISTNYFQPYARYQETYLQSRSMENEIPLAICNRTGQEQDLVYFGESAVYDALGHRLIKLTNTDQIGTIHIPLSKETDDKLSYMKNRIPNTYTEITHMEDQ